MNLERRYSKRYPMQGDVYIRYRKQRAFHAQAADCSLYGIRLNADNLTLVTGSVVELEFFYQGSQWLITGLVVYSRANEIGLTFWKTQRELYLAVMSRSSGTACPTAPAISGSLWDGKGQDELNQAM
jgi:hypothetical protein